jgi:hypothetical protein
MEARKAKLEETLLTQANIALMEQPLHMREIEEWRNRQAKYAPRYHAEAFVEFVQDREEVHSPPGCVRVRSSLAGLLTKLSIQTVQSVHSTPSPPSVQQGGIRECCEDEACISI